MKDADTPKKRLGIGKFRKVILILFDTFCFALIAAVYWFGAIRFSGSPSYTAGNYLIACAILYVCLAVSRFAFRNYANVLRYTSTSVYLKMIVSDAAGGVAAMLICRFAVPKIYEGGWMFVTVASLSALASLGSRFCYRLVYKYLKRKESRNIRKAPVVIVGAGQVGAMLANELRCNRASVYAPLFFIDSDREKIGSRVAGLKVYAENEKTFALIKSQDVEEIFFAISKLDHAAVEALYERYHSTGCRFKLYESPMGGSESAPQKGVLREFRIEDLLFRKQLTINDEKTVAYYSGKRILVTGGGGSIGSELCRQIAKCSPAQLIIFDIYENNAYDIQQELTRRYGKDLNLTVEIGSVRDRARLESVFGAYHPDVVFHAAAHKHVPLMEHSNAEAIKNNVLGTYNTADMAEKYGAEKFILISTDKAVNPTNVMGASKRMCEMVIQCRTDSKTSFAAVRFGNVLGSNGSVIPLFRRQIADGGPITITDKRIIRYFMTIPEASQLVIEAGAMAKKGELFVLDMGKPVRIYDLAVNMIRLCGFTPDKEIRIEEIGLRPGEKLYEELLIKTETLEKTDNNMIFIEKDTPLSRTEVEEKLAMLRQAVEDAKNEIASTGVREAMHRAVPTFKEPEEVNRLAAKAEEMKNALQQKETV